MPLKLKWDAKLQFELAKMSPDYEGFLQKRGLKRKTWKQRWFVLKQQYLFYSKAKGQEPQGIINILGCNIVRSESKKPNSFELFVPASVSDKERKNRTYYIASPSKEIAEKWIALLLQRIEVASAELYKQRMEGEARANQYIDETEKEMEKDEDRHILMDEEIKPQLPPIRKETKSRSHKNEEGEEVDSDEGSSSGEEEVQ